VDDCREHSNERSVYIKGVEFLGRVNNYQRITKESVLWSQLFC
jgi:hypothetical protein